MKGIVDLLRESFYVTIKKETIIIGLAYFAFSFIIALGAGIIATILGATGIFALIAINSMAVTGTALVLGILLAAIVLFALSTILSIFLYTGFYQIIQKNVYDFHEIGEAIKKRFFPTFLVTIIITMIVLIIMGIIVAPLYLALKEIGIIIGILVYLLLLVFIAPLIMLATPVVILEKVGALEAIGKAFSMGRKNYGLNLISIAALIAISLASIPIAIVPILGWAVSIIISLMLQVFTIKLYEENKARSR